MFPPKSNALPGENFSVGVPYRPSMGVEFELFVLLALMTLGFYVFTAFEVETRWWRKLLK